MNPSSTIYALSTPTGVGAIGVIRVSGPQAIAVVQNLTKKDLSQLSANAAVFCRLEKEDAILDETILTFFKAPHSFTGEDVLEIACHGSPYILQNIMHELGNNGAQIAAPGEFTMRAYLNGKMDLAQAEAVADLIAAESEAAHKIAMNQMRGGFSNEINTLREQLIHFASMIELELDFAEEDVEFANRDAFKKLIQDIFNLLNPLINSFEMGNVIKNGVPVVLAGRPNAGKSTLLNALLQEERAIVSEIAGTTRDTIEEDLIINGVKFRMIDTAGLREAQDQIEAIGIKRSLQKVAQAALVIYVFDMMRTEVKEVEKDVISLGRNNDEIILVANKADQLEQNEMINTEDFFARLPKECVRVSAAQQKGIHELKEYIYNRAIKNKINPNGVMVTNQRHLEALVATKKDLERVVEGMEQGISGDLIAMDVRQALFHLGSITGAITTDDLLGNIFSKFCIGK